MTWYDIVDTAVAASSMMAREESNDGTVPYDRGNDDRGAGGAVSSPSRTKPITAATATASSMARVESNDSNDGTVRYDRGDLSRGDRGAASLPRAHSRTKAIAIAAVTASFMARVVSNDGNDEMVRNDPLYASSSSTLSATTTTLKRDNIEGMSEYELLRLCNKQRNNARLASLGLLKA